MSWFSKKPGRQSAQDKFDAILEEIITDFNRKADDHTHKLEELKRSIREERSTA